MNATRQIGALSSDRKKRFFQFFDIDFYPEVIPNQLPDLLEKNYACVLFDMGVLGSATYPEFMRCELKLVAGSISPWKMGIYRNWLDKNQTIWKTNSEDIILLGNLGGKTEINRWKSQFRIPIRAVPYLENPFQLTSSDWTFFKELLKEN